MRVRRRRACVVQVADRLEPDFARLLAGEMVWAEATVAELICPFSPRPGINVDPAKIPGKSVNLPSKEAVRQSLDKHVAALDDTSGIVIFKV